MIKRFSARASQIPPQKAILPRCDGITGALHIHPEWWWWGDPLFGRNINQLPIPWLSFVGWLKRCSPRHGIIFVLELFQHKSSQIGTTSRSNWTGIQSRFTHGCSVGGNRFSNMWQARTYLTARSRATRWDRVRWGKSLRLFKLITFIKTNSLIFLIMFR